MPEKNQYAYMMEGFDREWNYVGNKREATYTNLDPGKYIFRVKGSNNDGIWNEEGTSLKIIITPPFWKTIWFRLSMIILIVLAVYTIHFVKVRNIVAHGLELEIKVAERTEDLKKANKQIAEKANELRLCLYSISRFKGTSAGYQRIVGVDIGRLLRCAR